MTTSPGSAPTSKYVAGSVDGKTVFDLIDIKVNPTAPTGLEVTTEYQDDDQDGASHQLASRGIAFSGTVRLTASPDPAAWTVGWIQTLYTCQQAVTYQSPDDKSRQGAMVSDVTRKMRDGDLVDPNDTVPHIWVESGSSSTEIQVGASEEVAMDDNPNVPFHPQYAGQKAPWINGWKAVEISGSKPFCSWLIAYANATREIVYLYYVHWRVDFVGRLDSAGDMAPAGGGTTVVSHGVGKGTDDPVLDDDPIEEDTFPFEPDAALLSFKSGH